MANHKSALKRARQSEITRDRNRSVKTRVKNLVKDVRAAATRESTEEAQAALNTAISAIDKASGRGVYHKKTASRKIARLTKLVNKGSLSQPA